MIDALSLEEAIDAAFSHGIAFALAKPERTDGWAKEVKARLLTRLRLIQKLPVEPAPDYRAIVERIHSMAIQANIRGKNIPAKFILSAIENPDVKPASDV